MSAISFSVLSLAPNNTEKKVENEKMEYNSTFFDQNVKKAKSKCFHLLIVTSLNININAIENIEFDLQIKMHIFTGYLFSHSISYLQGTLCIVRFTQCNVYLIGLSSLIYPATTNGHTSPFMTRAFRQHTLIRNITQNTPLVF